MNRNIRCSTERLSMAFHKSLCTGVGDKDVHIEDTEDDDILTDKLAEKVRMMILLQAIECDE